MQANLVFVAGASPQIITETAYCLLNEPPLDTDIQVFTTAPGRDIILRDLLGRGGAWNRFVRAYPRARRFHIAPGNITVLRDAAGRHLQDVRSREDNATVADQIAARLRDLTRDGAPPVHASIAGGRKTMGYLLAAAMMIYGRHDDRLSHVLVHPPELEGTDFYYPPPGPVRAVARRKWDQRTIGVSPQHVRVELADLPFLRLRALRDPAALQGAPFSRLVDELQSDLDALAAPRLILLPDGISIRCSGRTVRMSPVRRTIYQLLAERRRNGCANADCRGCERCFISAPEVGASFREALRSRLRQRQSAGVGANWDEGDFRAERSKINKTLARHLRAAAEPYEIRVTGGRGARLYGVALAPSAIEVQNN